MRSCITSDLVKEDEMVRSCSKHVRDEKCIQDFGHKASKDETTRQIDS